jgi:hypothetical protein
MGIKDMGVGARLGAGFGPEALPGPMAGMIQLQHWIGEASTQFRSRNKTVTSRAEFS